MSYWTHKLFTKHSKAFMVPSIFIKLLIKCVLTPTPNIWACPWTCYSCTWETRVAEKGLILATYMACSSRNFWIDVVADRLPMQRTKKQEVYKSHLLFSDNKPVALFYNSCRLDLPFRQASKELIAVIQSGLYKRRVTIRSEHGW